MRHFKQLTLATLFSLSAIFLLAGCGPTDGENGGPGGSDAKPSCTKASDCKSTENCVNLNAERKGYCKAKCSAPGTCADPTKQECVKFGTDANAPQACVDKCVAGKCGKGHICENGVCIVKGCTGASDSSCGPDRQCNDEYKACEAKPSSDGPGPVGPTGKKCTNATVGTACGRGPTWSCNTGTDTSANAQGTCERRPLAAVVIQDLSHVGDPACKGGDKGADILGVALVGTDGTIGAWGRNINPQQLAPSGGDASNAYYVPGEPSGPVSVTALDQCQKDGLSARDFSSTGCGGYLIFSFDNVSGNSYSTLAEGKVQVYEYDGNKCAASKPSTPWPDDKYAVWGCVSADIQGVTDFASVSTTFINKYCAKLSGTKELNGNASVNYPPAAP